MTFTKHFFMEHGQVRKTVFLYCSRPFSTSMIVGGRVQHGITELEIPVASSVTTRRLVPE